MSMFAQMHARIIMGLLLFIGLISGYSWVKHKNKTTKKLTIAKIISWYCFACILNYGLVLYYIPSVSWYVVHLSFILFVLVIGYFVNEHINILSCSLSVYTNTPHTSSARRYRRIIYIFSLFITIEAMLIFKPKEFPFDIPEGLAMAIAAAFAAYLSAEIAENVIEKQNRVEIAKNRQRNLEMLQSEMAQLLSAFDRCKWTGDSNILNDINFHGYKIGYYLDPQNLLTSTITKYITICKTTIIGLIHSHPKKDTNDGASQQFEEADKNFFKQCYCLQSILSAYFKNEMQHINDILSSKEQNDSFYDTDYYQIFLRYLIPPDIYEQLDYQTKEFLIQRIGSDSMPKGSVSKSV